jgi:aminopeptidase N
VAGRRWIALLLAGAVLAAGGCTGGRYKPRAPRMTAPPLAGIPSTPIDDAVKEGRSNPVPDASYPERGNASLDVLHYDLALRWAPATSTLTGTATLRIRAAKPLSTVSLDFGHWYSIDGATVDGKAATPTVSDKDKVTVPDTVAADNTTTVVLRYHGTPHQVPMPSVRDDAEEGLGLRVGPGGELWTMQEPYGAFTWYPVNELPSDKARYDITVTVPSGWTAVASGEPFSKSPGPDGDRWGWRGSDPQASYLTTLAVGHYTRTDLTGPHDIPIRIWTRTGKDDALIPALRRTDELMRWLDSRFGWYPFETAGVVTVDSVSAMETQEVVTLGAKVAGDLTGARRDEYLQDVVLHELSHHWFGDAVTPTDWHGLWLNEGFATWIQFRWEIEQGQTTKQRWMNAALDEDGDLRKKFGPPGAPDPRFFAQHNVYTSGALLLQAIDDRVGDDAFIALLRDWVQDHRDGNVDRAMFTAYANKHTGQDLTALINAWLDSPTTPPPALGGR